MYSVYILYSPSVDVFYKGQTKDLINRINRHNRGLEKSTKHGISWILIWRTTKKTRAEAMKLETKLKNLNRQKTLEFIQKYAEGIVGRDEALLIERMSRC